MNQNSSNLPNPGPIKAESHTEHPTRLTRNEKILGFGLGLFASSLGAFLVLVTGNTPTPPGPGPAPTLDHPRHLIDFALTDRTGRPVTRTDLQGKFVVVNFMFTSCSLSCRTVNDRMQEIQSMVAQSPDVLLLSLTVDPRTDSPSVLRTFAEGLHADTNRWLFLTGEKARVHELIESSFLTRSTLTSSPIPGGFDGTHLIMLVDPSGGVAGSFDGMNRNIATAVTTEIKNLRNHPRRS
ncbi:MAG: SCO family protein [Verrucomicrobia bacterium]|nr:SCO family protein [Verrucomicrobiota bacterium]